MEKDDDYRRQAMLELFKTDLQHHETLASAVVTMIQSALRVSVLLNGGAIIAALSVYAVNGAANSMPKWALGIAAFVWLIGLVAGATATGAATRAQREFQAHAGNQFRLRGRTFFGLPIPKDEDSSEPHAARGYRFRAASIWAWRVSIASFAVGATVAIWGLVYSAG